MDKKQVKSLLLLHVLLLFNSLGGIFSKTAAGEPFLSVKWIICYGILIGILGVYAICWQQIIRVLPLNIAYLNKSVTLIWAAVWGILFFNERISLTFIIGGVFVMAGILLIITGNNESTG